MIDQPRRRAAVGSTGGSSRRAADRSCPRLMRRPAFFCVLVLTGEEIPDLYQKLASEHPDTDPFIRESIGITGKRRRGT